MSGTPAATVVDDPKLERISLRTTPLSARMFGPFEPSPGNGPAVSSGTSAQLAAVASVAAIPALSPPGPQPTSGNRPALRPPEPEQLEDAPSVKRAEVVDEPAVVLLDLVVVVDGRRVDHLTGLRKDRNAGSMLGADPDKLLTAA